MNNVTQSAIDYIKQKYNAEPEYMWNKLPDAAAIRNSKNKKWFALIMHDLPKKHLGLKTDECSDVMNLKCEPLFSYMTIDRERIFPAYHMNKEHWISVLMDENTDFDELCKLIDMSFDLVDKK